MVRISKDPEVRRKELIDIAISLFAEKGYENTSVSDIVKNADVAQGTFYYYFKSKDEILDAILDMSIEEVKKGMETLIAQDADAVSKLLKFFNIFYSIFRNRERIYNYLHEESNALLHLKAEKKISPMVVPIFTEIIEQGVKEGVFSTSYPRAAAVSVFASIDALHEDSGKIDDLRELEASLYDVEYVRAIFDIIERIVGAQPGILLKFFQEWWSKREVD
jgi:AcrR family transcriptional regulator